MAHEKAPKLAPLTGAKTPALGIRDAKVPIRRKGNARDPVEETECKAPDRNNDDKAFAEKAALRPGFEYSEILEQQCYFDKGNRQWITKVADV